MTENEGWKGRDREREGRKGKGRRRKGDLWSVVVEGRQKGRY